MSGADHYTECERLINDAFHALENGQRAMDMSILAEAQVRGLLAVADAIDDLRKALKP